MRHKTAIYGNIDLSVLDSLVCLSLKNVSDAELENVKYNVCI